MTYSGFVVMQDLFQVVVEGGEEHRRLFRREFDLGSFDKSKTFWYRTTISNNSNLVAVKSSTDKYFRRTSNRVSTRLEDISAY